MHIHSTHAGVEGGQASPAKIELKYYKTTWRIVGVRVAKTLLNITQLTPSLHSVAQKHQRTSNAR